MIRIENPTDRAMTSEISCTDDIVSGTKPSYWYELSNFCLRFAFDPTDAGRVELRANGDTDSIPGHFTEGNLEIRDWWLSVLRSCGRR